MQLLADIDEETVDMQPTYDGSREEPKVLPSRFPNLLVNGSQGIAVGMATNIPPHNLGEVIDAALHLLAHPDATADDLMQFVKGPDFPTGGSILGRAGIMDAYRTGRGSIKMRATAAIEEGKRGQMQIVVTELPYQTSCSAIAGRIQELVDGGDLDGIADVNDGSAGGKTSLVVTLKRDANANVVLNNLYKLTQLQTSFGVNMVALVDGVPRTLNLVTALQGYLRHQVDVITRRSQFRLDKARKREHILDGRLKALDVIDQIIALIRASDDPAAAKAGLMAEPFEFSELQAQDILEMRLAQLTRLSRIDIEQEIIDVRARIVELEAILADPAVLNEVIRSEMTAIKEEFATPRVCQIGLDDGEMTDLDLVEDKELVIVMTEAQYVKAVTADSFKTQGRGGRGVSGAKLKTDDIVHHVIFTTAHAFLLFFSNRGRVYRLRAMDIPERERTAKGMPIVNLLPLQAGENIQAIIDTRDFAGERNLFFATRMGVVKKTSFHEYDNGRRDGLIALNLREGDELVRVIETSGQRRHLHGQPQGLDDPLQRRRGAGDGPRRLGSARHEDEGRRRGCCGRCRPRRHRHPHDHFCRLRQAHPTRQVQRSGPWWPRCDRYPAHRQEGPGRRGVHGRPRRRDRRRVEQRGHDPHGCARHLVAGPRCDRREGDERRRRPIGRVGRSDHRQRRGVDPPAIPAIEPQLHIGVSAHGDADPGVT